MLYQVECDNGHRYTQETEAIDDKSHLRPYQCGVCGTREIRVWALVYGLVTKARMTVIAPAHPAPGNDKV